MENHHTLAHPRDIPALRAIAPDLARISKFRRTLSLTLPFLLSLSTSISQLSDGGR